MFGFNDFPQWAQNPAPKGIAFEQKGHGFVVCETFSVGGGVGVVDAAAGAGWVFKSARQLMQKLLSAGF
jgi:hypothetical protein